MNHAIVNPPVDRNKAADEVKDVFITIQKETDAGIYVSGAKVVATSSAITHYNFLGQNAAMPINDTDLAIMFIAPMNAPGVKLFCRASYEMTASALGTPFDYPLSSRFDENDAIFVFDNVFIPWENVLIHRDLEKIKTFYPRSGFLAGYQFQGCTRLAVKLDFLVGIIAKALRATGADEFRGNQAMLGEVIAWRNLFWAISDAMAMNPMPWVGAPCCRTRSRARATGCSPATPSRASRDRGEDRRLVLIYLPSSAKDFKNPAIDKYLEKCARLQRHRLQRAHQDHEAAVGCGRHRVRRPSRALRDQLRRQPRGHPHPGDVQRQGLGRLRADDRARRSVHGRLRRERLDRRYLAQPGDSEGDAAGWAQVLAGRRGEWVPSRPMRCTRLPLMSWLDQHDDMAGSFGRSAGARDRDQFREAMSRLGAAVHVVTTDGPAGKTGFTATAVCSVSDQPATLLVCLNRGAASADPADNRVLCVNTLRAGEEMVADMFAGRTKVARDERFDSRRWINLSTGAPVCDRGGGVRLPGDRGRRSRPTTSISRRRGGQPGPGRRARLSRARLQAGVSRFIAIGELSANRPVRRNVGRRAPRSLRGPNIENDEQRSE